MHEPYRIKVVEPLPRVARRKRKDILRAVAYNPFHIPAKYVTIDLVSDSGTGAMTARQWAAMIEAREDFAGQKSFEAFVEKTQRRTGFPFIQPVHQGRSAENILFKLLLKPGDVVLANTHFETTRGNIEALNCRAVDLPSAQPPFLGNIDIDKLNKEMRKLKRVKLVILTLTNNIKGGQPVSLKNIAQTRSITQKYNINLVLDTSRFADNAYLIKETEKSRMSVAAICKRMFRSADILYFSNKKDGLVNIGGCIGVRSKQLYDRLTYEVLRQEAYPTSGGLAARDVAAMTLGMADAMNEDFLRAHIGGIRYLAAILKKNCVKVFEPVGGHAVAVIPKSGHRYFSFALASQVFLETGIRGGVFEEYYRLAVPRRVYTREQLRHVGESVSKAYTSDLPRLRLINRPHEFFNFFARFATV
jgi:tryptophanase